MLNELYLKRNIKPKGIAHLRCGIGFGGNYSDYVELLNSKLINNPNGLPEYILCDSLCIPGIKDYLPVIKKYKKIKTWEYYRPSYRESGFDFLYKLKEYKKFNLNDILSKVNVISKDNGSYFINSDRRNAIMEILDYNENVELMYRDDYVLLYSTGIEREGDIILISCHIDSVFNKKELFLIFEEEGKIRGTLDNSGTIASLLYSLQEYKYPANVLIAFTGGEEEGFYGAQATRDCLEDEFEDLYDRLGMVITLDISPDNFNYDVSIENLNIEMADFEKTQIRFESIKDLKDKIKKILDSHRISYGIIENAEPDESYFYAEWDLNTISLCLPCLCPDNDPHSIQGCITTLNKISKHAETIKILCEEILK